MTRARRLGSLVGALLLLLLAGCAGSRTAPDQAGNHPGPGSLQKKIGLAPFIDMAGFKEPVVGFFQRSFVQAIHTACPEILLAVPENEIFPENRIPRLESGWVDNLAVARIGREEGWTAVVNAALVNADIVDQRKGFWWFKRTRYFTHVEIHVEVYDTETGAKVLDEFILEEEEIEGLESPPGGRLVPEQIPEIQERVAKAIDTAGGMICRAVNHQRWKTFITQAEGEEIQLASGRESGIQPGDVLQVFGTRGDPIQGTSGQFFAVPGSRIGVLKVTEVFPNTARAVAVSGSGFSAGDTVRP